MSKPTPPSPKYMKKRRDFFLAHLDLPKARWEVFHLTNLLIRKDYEERKIDRPEYLRQLKELDRTQGLTPAKSEMEKLNDNMFH